MKRSCATLLVILASAQGALADGPRDNQPDHVRPVPPPGIAVPAAERAGLEAGLAELGRLVRELPPALRDRPDLADLLPDVIVYTNAVRYALAYNEFFQPREFAVAHDLLRQGIERARLLRRHQAPWTTATGLIVRGYVSRIDGSVQPYGLVVPASYRANAPYRHRLDVWLHGRGETLSELNFIAGRQKSAGEFTPPHALVLHPYGRYCNANTFAGEVDVLEALEHVRKHYRVDDDRVLMRGFSMGGAGCWQFAVHHADRWAAAAPGAGFAETAEFLKEFQKEVVAPPWYERKLWHLYDCTDYAANLFNCPVIAYSGEIDSQKQAADVMARALAAEGIDLVHLIGPKTGHAYHPRTREALNERIDRLAARGRNPLPSRVRLTTYTLRYPRMFWVRVDGLGRHWERARVDAELHPGRNQVAVATENVKALTLSMPPGLCPLDVSRRPRVRLDGRDLEAAPVRSDRSWEAHFRRIADGWLAVPSPDDGVLRKRPGLQGPIDDAFMDSFLMVRPTGRPWNDRVGAWVRSEQMHAVEHWRRQFRGEARVKDDVAVGAGDIAAHNLVLWGDPQSNHVLAKIADRLPIRWDAHTVRVGRRTYDAADHVPVLIYPNPLNPERYIVLNSGFTFREYDYLNNARQVPKLPDFAVIDTRTPASSRAPGGIAAAGFFDERWQVPDSER